MTEVISKPPKFRDLRDGGRELAKHIEKLECDESIVLAIANSGVPVAIPLAEALHAPLDVLAIRRLIAFNNQPPMCAINVAGKLVVTSTVAGLSNVEEQFVREAVDHLTTHVEEMRNNSPAKNLAGSNVILVDNGIHTGSTVRLAIDSLRTLQAARIDVAVPVADESARACVANDADNVYCLHWSSNFGHAGLWYENFTRPDDAGIREMLAQYLTDDRNEAAKQRR